MTGTNDGTPAAVADTSKADESKALLADMAEALANYGNPDTDAGHSTEARKEETKETKAPPAKDAETPPATETDKAPEPPKPSNFDALPDGIRTTFEKLHKGETLTAEERAALVAEIPKGYLRQSDYTKKRMSEKAAAEELQGRLKSQLAENGEMIQTIKNVLRTPEAHRDFLERYGKAGAPATEVDLDALDPKDRVKAVEGIVDAKLTAEKRAAQTQAEADAQAEAALTGVATEWRETVKDEFDGAERTAILNAVEAKFTKHGANLLRVPPALVAEELSEQTEKARLKKQNADLTKQLTRKQADAARSAKASSEPSGRVTPRPTYDLRNAKDRADEALAREGITDWNSQVAFGNRGPETAI